MEKTTKSGVAVDVFSGSGLGLLLGVIMGMAHTPVVATVVGAITSLLAVFLGLEGSGSKLAEITKVRLNGVRIGSFALATVAGLFLGRAIVIGLVAALLGYAVGTALGLEVAPQLFQATSKAVRAEPIMLAWSLVAAPLVAALASLLPATIASTHDPAVVLRTE